MTSLRDKVVFITGGARGIGAEVARRLNAKGARLVLTDLNDAELTSLAAELGEERVLTAVADVRDLSAMQAAADRAVERFGGIDVVLANAGIASYGSVAQVDPDAFRRVLDINVLGVFHTVRATLPAVIERRGYVLIVSSLAAYAACPGLAPYNASKAGVEMLANALRLEVARHGVKVGSAHMSWINTALVRDTQNDLPAFDRLLASLPWPLNKTTTVDKCAAAFVKGIQRRRARIYCPRWVALFRWAKPVLSSRLGEMPLHSPTAELLPALDAQVAALGRSMSAANVELLRPDRGSARN
ncbi:SDR family oxidoreductase [Mycobacterium avium subsp. paratuberculosis]|uniref:SDR family oxidoreductase n=1 Tax=Mycobacterium avium TaxID=1764 RepID=UPI000213AF99|nr:SDR family oxidoreductase [Mycobacterium avium]ETB11948.1 short-chain dehydrogenase [Mycobacterium avium subsp. paratuberculosis 08-8281]ETB39904.1 short-chain dehydrogenase [Mycobacterium avium subsp. paratuberculosis 11-1786]QPM71816.1 SDR family oxidoreductase [Mycobacterium avium subsp. paratuberculosis S397]QQK50155.1 SDR family oxidoreductase [Mycobacterium avium subsp. paratuberculosis]WAI56322.1 SDR family oxidoreductase [Mycobacterium avium subsp. paratuberculosis]